MAMKQELTSMNSNTMSVDGSVTITNTGNLNTISPISWGVGIPSQWDSTITSTAPITYDLEVIQGKILQCNYVMSRYEFISNKQSADDVDQIKRRLTEMLVDKIFQDNLVYFTKIEDTITDEVKFIARMGVLEKDKTEFVAKKLRKT